MGEMGGVRKANVGRRRWKATALGAVLVAVLASGAASGETGKIGGMEGIGENSASAALGKSKESGEGGESRGALERAFWETLARCESPILLERDAAEDALVERFAEFEPFWQDRRFLTNGEIGAEARARFELAEARRREQVFEECVAAFEAAFEIDAPATPETQNGKEEAIGEIGRIEGNEGVGEIGEVGEARGRIRLRWRAPLRIG